MTSEPLTICINCGHQISRRAAKCSNCNSENVTCRICNRRIKRDDLIRDDTVHHFAMPLHSECLARFFVVPASLCCSDCKRPLVWPTPTHVSKPWPWSGNWSSCPSCGAPDPLGSLSICKTCGLPILTLFQEKATDDVYTTFLHHGFCRPDLSARSEGTFPDWNDGFRHWRSLGSGPLAYKHTWGSDAPPSLHTKTSGCLITLAAVSLCLMCLLWLL